MDAATITAEELLTSGPRNKRCELIRGRLVVREPAGARHGSVTAELAFQLMAHVKAGSLGRVYAAETGFKIESDPDTVRAPDIAFVAEERAPESDPIGFPDYAPDLVVEVLGTDDRPGEVLAKVGDWLNAGVRLVWVVSPERREVRVYRFDGSVSTLGERDRLDGEGVLPGFTCPLGELW
ncbi:MAG: Uma2 family endonuclease [Gemmatimonadetes bacterium]|uniref:Uma2 family endonuclease n=1 Tax=Candidatus Kutchimonas denitrificans TaxID=3056748 RepID=A0AAE4ZB16_9BACT|nr:Uma2 family endonuclease [Gemmatimonadota bacterium]NIR75877.1 Uma2 family endonuclease [Candidatus Kutchimonas denitrificans]NIS00389.1 Uma2 family endonuclease [Gemmatimonadota bacterium]NIT66053.1 Uma2 family endonuclease [Gemmatimonadota bacterium]NIU54807.1 Uma2 family endonuclease [Gemmatimonadota bacterium]